jgi:protein-S-isoprenylcysteine O-methyltransferase Ste14
MIARYVVLLCVFLLCLAIRTTYELLKRSARVTEENTVVFSVVFAAMCLLWFTWFAMGPMDPARVAVPAAARWVALLAFVTGLVLAIGALAQLRGVEHIDHLVTTGLFARLRHPMYCGFVLWIVGWAAYHGALVSFAAGLVAIANIAFWRRLEEWQLETRYAGAYRAYRAGTWF